MKASAPSSLGKSVALGIVLIVTSMAVIVLMAIASGQLNIA
ncbi:MAG TPA: hypothetical protein ACFCUY_09580 [Xenococcaceae cyanobacterium]|jgi:hypothetical protein